MNTIFRHLVAPLLFSIFVPVLPAQLQSDRAPQYRLQCSDVLDIQYRYTPEFNQQATIRPDGRITVSGMGDVMAAGLTLQQITAAITDLSGQRLKDPQLTVLLKEFQKPYIFVGGEVANPGRFELRGDLTAIEAVSLAGGFKPSAKHSEVLLVRKGDGEHIQTSVLDLKALIGHKTMNEDTALKPGDMLYIPQNTLSKIERLMRVTPFSMYYDPIR
ncbi:MAG TPA: polysaccharide biosynthesis/export family protein [Bryobacteraceae bacterium]|nr:polysaccharide biosynthesis/export family protein [Bryobacteraceae bacterium]